MSGLLRGRTVCVDGDFREPGDLRAEHGSFPREVLGRRFDVRVSRVEADFDEGAFHVSYDIVAASLHDPTSPGNEWVDFNDVAVSTTDFGFQTTLDCVLDVGVNRGGRFLGTDEVVLTDEYRFDVINGSACELVATSGGFLSLPCVDTENTTWAL